MRIAAKLTLAQLALAAVLALVALVALRSIDKVSNQLEAGVNRQMPLMRALEDAKVAAREIGQHASVGLDFYLIAGQLNSSASASAVKLRADMVLNRVRAELLGYQSELDQRLALAAELVGRHYGEEDVYLTRVRNARERLRSAVGQYLAPADGSSEARTLALGSVNAAVGAFIVAVDGWLAHEREEFNTNSGVVLAAAGEAHRNTYLIGALALLVVGLVGYRVSRSVSRPIQVLTAALQETAAGNRRKVDVGGGGEVRVLADTFNDMVDELARTTVTKAYVDRIVESMPDALLVLDARGRIKSANEAALEQVGRSRETLVGQPFSALVKDPGWPLPDKRAAPGHIVHGDTSIARREGAPIDVSMSACIIQGATVHDEEIVVVWQDIRERLTMMRSLEAAKASAEVAARAKSDFLATMSHEIRTPMHGVLGMTELMLGDELSARQRMRAQKALRSGQHLLAILNDILDFSKFEAGRLTLESIAFDVHGLIEDVIALHADQAALRALELQWEIGRDVPREQIGDPGRVRQVLNNLLSNAVKFTERGAVSVAVTRRLDDAGVRIYVAVSDTGIGIAPNAQARLFKPFSQADGSTTRRFGGSGLGLAICKQLVDAMGGQIGVDSTPGQGSTFWFTLPVRTPSDAPAADAADRPRATANALAAAPEAAPRSRDDIT